MTDPIKPVPVWEIQYRTDEDLLALPGRDLLTLHTRWMVQEKMVQSSLNAVKHKFSSEKLAVSVIAKTMEILLAEATMTVNRLRRLIATKVGLEASEYGQEIIGPVEPEESEEDRFSRELKDTVQSLTRAGCSSSGADSLSEAEIEDALRNGEGGQIARP